MGDTTREAAQRRLAEIEAAMARPEFWNDKEAAQRLIKEMNEIKGVLAGAGKYDAGNAIVTLVAGAGGNDAEDFAAMLKGMYERYAARRGWEMRILHQNVNDHGGYRNITMEFAGRGAYGTLKWESGVHRLVRISPFNAKKLRHTSFALVDVVPDMGDTTDITIPPADVSVEFSRSSGPGGQNVNKRETAVRVVHIPTGISVHVDSERSQLQNREKALKILKGKLYTIREEAARKEEDAYRFAKGKEVAWGNQIRSYVLHPYKMVKDHRTDVEARDVDAVLERGEIDVFIDAARSAG